MVKILKINKKTFGDVLRQRKLDKLQLAREKEAAIQVQKDLQFDEFVRNTAKDMLKDTTARYQLQVNNANENFALPSSSSENSVWAPWSKMSKS